ncbi:xylulokinase [Fusibacter bizertensis]|uniref:Xylulose kinase n=1 Tax=Fusibacter bizertensis TaxID=1488331 RepID=A0ABT6N7X6_9FIRM|nr:xylulokinase [Fusibacter bizertensis]MDH8676524.1 xylulokinase [Fusibacter bizertensis]
MYFIGVDLGTSSVKILVMDDKGQILSTVTKDYPLYFPKALWSEQNPQDWLEQSLVGIKEALLGLETSKVKAISFSGQMHGLVMLDSHDNVIRPAILWNDQRSIIETNYLNEEIGIDKLTSYTGNIAFPGFTAPKLLWVKENEPENFAKINKVMLPKDYLAYKMTGNFATDYADASGSLYLDVESKTWSQDMLEILGIEDAVLPKLYESYASIGTLSEEVSLYLGFDHEVTVTIGSGDQACAAVGGGVVSPGRCSVSLGTSGVVFVHSDTFIKDPNNGLHAFCHANGAYHLMGCMLSAAGSLKWWVEEILKSNDYDHLMDYAEEAKLDNGLYFLPYLMGERSPHNDPHARGVFWGLNLSHSQGDMTRAVIEGVAFGLRDSFEIVQSLGQEITEIRINGGGSKNDFWCQMIADVLSTKVVKLETDAGPAYGAAILAAVGSGQFESVKQACDTLIKTTDSYMPSETQAIAYDKKYKSFAKLYPALKALFPEV